MKFHSIFFAILIIFSCQSESPIVPSNKEEPAISPGIDSLINSLAIDNSLPSFSAAIVSRDSVLWQHYYGFSDHEKQVKANQETVYSIASISKLVTATAVMQQVTVGKIDLNADINNYLDFAVRSPHFPKVSITVRMLLTHRSALSSPYNKDDPDFFIPFEGESAPNLGNWLKSYLIRPVAWMSFAPGTSEQYSNHGAALLGYIVERVTNQDFKEYCRDHIFIPLEMHDTSFDLDDIDPQKLATIHHHNAHFQYSVPYFPATSLKTSIKDFSRFISMYLNNGSLDGVQILKPNTVLEMMKIKSSGSSLGYLWWSYGNGWSGHAGAYYGATTFTELNRKENLGVILFCNKTQWLLSQPGLLWPEGAIFDLVHNYAIFLGS